jgi:deoxyribodipyrimidine photo-lyase
MISASFLTKHLLIDYRLGEAHYLKYLTDDDWANNNLGWQWSAGCGVDAQPWFRVFNPILQGTRFDPDGTYVKTWISELRDVPRRDVHEPEADRRPRIRPRSLPRRRERSLGVASAHHAPRAASHQLLQRSFELDRRHRFAGDGREPDR